MSSKRSRATPLEPHGELPGEPATADAASPGSDSIDLVAAHDRTKKRKQRSDSSLNVNSEVISRLEPSAATRPNTQGQGLTQHGGSPGTSIGVVNRTTAPSQVASTANAMEPNQGKVSGLGAPQGDRAILQTINMFFCDFGEEPKQSGNRHAREPDLAKYLQQRRSEKKGNRLSAELEQLAKEICPWFLWETPHLQQHKAILACINAFHTEVGDEPKKTGGRHPNEIEYADYLHDRRCEKKDGCLDPEIESLMKQRCPWFTWESLFWQQHKAVLARIKAFYTEFGDEPKHRHKNKERPRHDQEQEFAKYLSNRRRDKKCGKLDAEVENLIRDRLPWFKWESPVMQRHKNTLIGIASFYAKHGEEPKQGKTRHEKEFDYAIYLLDRRRDKKKGKLDPAVEAMITERLPWFVWDSLKLQHHTTMLAEISDFYLKYGEEPKQRQGKARHDKESELSWYLAKRRREKKIGTLPPTVTQLIEQSLPWFEWESVLVRNMRATLTEIAEFCKEFGEEPQKKGRRYDGKEEKLFSFLAHRRSQFGKDPALDDLFREILPSLPLSQIHFNSQIKSRNDDNDVLYDRSGQSDEHGDGVRHGKIDEGGQGTNMPDIERRHFHDLSPLQASIDQNVRPFNHVISQAVMLGHGHGDEDVGHPSSGMRFVELVDEDRDRDRVDYEDNFNTQSSHGGDIDLHMGMQMAHEVIDGYANQVIDDHDHDHNQPGELRVLVED